MTEALKLSELPKAEAILSKASPPPWRADEGLGCKRIMAGKSGRYKQAQYQTEICCTPGLSDEEEDKANAESIAYTRAAFPRALETIQRLATFAHDVACGLPRPKEAAECLLEELE